MRKTQCHNLENILENTLARNHNSLSPRPEKPNPKPHLEKIEIPPGIQRLCVHFRTIHGTETSEYR